MHQIVSVERLVSYPILHYEFRARTDFWPVAGELRSDEITEWLAASHKKLGPYGLCTDSVL